MEKNPKKITHHTKHRPRNEFVAVENPSTDHFIKINKKSRMFNNRNPQYPDKSKQYRERKTKNISPKNEIIAHEHKALLHAQSRVRTGKHKSTNQNKESRTLSPQRMHRLSTS